MCVFKLLQALIYLCLLQELQIVAKLHLNEKSLKITLPSCGKKFTYVKMQILQEFGSFCV